VNSYGSGGAASGEGVAWLAQQRACMLRRRYDALGLLTPSYTDQSTGYRSYTVDRSTSTSRHCFLKRKMYSCLKI
jgi:hypothetical protein